MLVKRYLQGRFTVPIIIFSLLIFALWFDSLNNIYTGYIRIISSSGILLSDYLAIGGLSATLLNVSIIIFAYFLLIYSLHIKITGPIFAGLLTIAGFAFFGKNIVNTTPILIGIYLYSLFNKINMRNVMIIVLFSTGISPIVSFIMFNDFLPVFLRIPFGIIAGIVTGFILPPFAAHTVKFHNGYDLYNIGFAMGILALIYTAIFRAFGIPVEIQNIISEMYHEILFFILSFFSFVFIVLAYLLDRDVHKKYFLILEKSGRLVADFVRDVGLAPTILNIGLMGLVSLIFVILLDIKISGPVVGGILTVMGFAAFGKHPKNSVPVMLGVTLSAYLSNFSLNNAGVVIAVFFGTALAPISGKYGIFAGFFAGFIHFFVVQATSTFQGGFDLYNNGFAAGFVAAVLVPVIDSFRKEII